MDLQLPDIFNTTIVHNTFDRNWEAIDHYPLIPKDTLVLSTEYLPNSAEEQQLIKMLTACKLTAEQYQIVQISSILRLIILMKYLIFLLIISPRY
jgi:hypothetical protein